MPETDFLLARSKIAIIGLGLMGGSLALALKGKCAALYGIDSHRPTLELALSQQIVDYASSDPAGALPEVDLVVLAAPVPAILTLLDELPSFTSSPCIVTDLGSTKRSICEAMSRLPENFDPIGGHPICGRETLSLENADGALYRDAPFVITPTSRVTECARSAVKQIIFAIEARLIEMCAEEHDRALAFTSHLPFLLSSALVNTLPREYAGLIGSGFRSNSRLAGTPASIMLGILRSNRENVLSALQKFQTQLADLERALTSNDASSLESALAFVRETHQALM